MKEDIEELKVEGIGVAIVPSVNELNEQKWDVYLINTTNDLLKGVLVSSRGYGEKDGEKIETSMLRHFLDEVEPTSFRKIEPIIEDVFGLSNEYWVSFYINNKMRDKKFVFVKGIVEEANFTTIPVMNERGVLIL